MKRLICNEKNSFKYEDVKDPIKSPGEVLIKMEYLGVCGSDIHAYSGNQPFFTYPKVLGHEIAGTVVEGDNFNSGDKVIVIPYFGCGKCIACKSGIENACVSLKVLGVHVDGAMQDYICIPEKYVMKYESISEEYASMIEPLAISSHAVRRAGVKKGEIALVVGAGPIGIGAAQVIKAHGGEVILADINDKKLEKVSKSISLKGVLNPLSSEYRDEVTRLTNGEFPSLIVDATGNSISMEGQVKNLAHSGRIVFIGLTKGDLKINDIEFHKREAVIYRSRGANRSDFEYVIENIKNSKLDPSMLITHKTNFKEFKKDFSVWVKDEELIKGVIKF